MRTIRILLALAGGAILDGVLWFIRNLSATEPGLQGACGCCIGVVTTLSILAACHAARG